MNRRLTRLLAICLVGLLLSFFGAFPVSAAKPTVDPFGSIHTEFLSCGSFDAITTFGVDGKIVLFSDDAGKLVRVDTHFQLALSAQNSESGKIFNARTGKFLVREDLLNHTGGEVGLISQLVIPGQGHVSLRAGRIISDDKGDIIFEHGRNQEGDLVQALCFVLAQP